MKFLDEKIGYVDAVNPDLTRFKKSGGKLLITHGWSDTGITPETTVWYLTSRRSRRWATNRATGCACSWLQGWATAAAAPASTRSTRSARSRNGWEKGQAPATMLGTGANGMTRPLCPYPQYAEYKGSGDLKDGANWSCKAPK